MSIRGKKINIIVRDDQEILLGIHIEFDFKENRKSHRITALNYFHRIDTRKEL